MLNEYSVVLLKNYFDFPLLLGVTKENIVLYNNKSHIEKKVLIALNANLEKLVTYQSIAEKVVSVMEMSVYLEKNQNELRNVYNFAHTYQLSWLEELQINELNRLNTNSKDNLNRLTQFYQQVLWDK